MANMEKESEFFRSPSCSALNLKWVVFLAIFLAAAQLRAQTWNAGTGSWFNPLNWTPATVPAGATVVTVANGGTTQIAAATANAGDLTIGLASTVQIGAGGLVNVNRSLLIDVGGTLRLDDGSFMFFGRPTAQTNNGNIILDETTPTSEGHWDGNFAGTGSITKIGTGTLTLQASLTLTALAHLFVNEGTVVNDSSSIGAAVVTGSNSILKVASTVTLGITPTINNAGTLDNAGNITAGVISNFAGANIINESTGFISSVNGNAILLNAGGTVTNNANGTITGANTGIFSTVEPVTITNYGKIVGTESAIGIAGGGTFVNEAGASVTGTNFESVEIRSAGTVMIINSGTISSNYGGIGFDAGGGTIVNNAGGVIRGTGANVQGPGVDSFGIAASSTTIPVAVINSGTISGGRIRLRRQHWRFRDEQCGWYNPRNE
jgi:fibronectin-binding autotransporter adhesin